MCHFIVYIILATVGFQWAPTTLQNHNIFWGKNELYPWIPHRIPL